LDLLEGDLIYLLGFEYEALAPEDQEFEVARRFVRFAGASARNAGRLRGGMSPTLAAQRACADAQTIFATAADLRKEAQRLRDAAGAARAESEAARYAREDVPDSPTET